jgi:hypothetical protein
MALGGSHNRCRRISDGLEGADKGFLKLGRTIARQAASLPVHERRAFIRREIADLREMYEPIYRTKASSPGRELLESMEGWVTRLVKILEKDT